MGTLRGFLKPTVLAGGTAGSMFGKEDETKREGKHSENSGTLSLSLSLSCIRWSKGDGKIACLGMGQTRISAALRQNPCMDSSRLKIPFFAVLLPSVTLKVSKDE